MKHGEQAVALAILLCSGCGEEGGGGSGGGSAPPAVCDANVKVNGDTVIAGPSASNPPMDNDSCFRSLAVDPLDPNVVYVGTENNGLLKSTDGGTTWTRLRKGLEPNGTTSYSEAWDIAIHPAGNANGVFVAMTGSPGSILLQNESYTAGVYRTGDGGSTWARSNCGLFNSKASSIVYDPNDPNILILGIEGGAPTFSPASQSYYDGGLYRSTDGGASWAPISLPPLSNKNGYWHLRARGTGPTTFYTFGFNYSDLTENVGFLKSADGGQTWTSFGALLKNKRITWFDVSADGNTIYADERDSFQIRKSVDGGATWTVIPSGANGVVRVFPSDPQRVLYSGSSDIYLSTDGLSTSLVVLPPGGPPIEDIEFAPSNPGIVYAYGRGYRVYKSVDAGATWVSLINLRDWINAHP